MLWRVDQAGLVQPERGASNPCIRNPCIHMVKVHVLPRTWVPPRKTARCWRPPHTTSTRNSALAAMRHCTLSTFFCSIARLETPASIRLYSAEHILAELQVCCWRRLILAYNELPSMYRCLSGGAACSAQLACDRILISIAAIHATRLRLLDNNLSLCRWRAMHRTCARCGCSRRRSMIPCWFSRGGGPCLQGR